jgi:hypothetical protein
MSNQSTLETLQKGGVEIPGLDFNTVINALVKSLNDSIIEEEKNLGLTYLADYIKGMDKASYDKFIDEQKKALGQMVKEQITIIKAEFKSIQEQIKQVQETVGILISSVTAGAATAASQVALNPTTGAAASTAMIAQNLLDLKAKKGIIAGVVTKANNSGINLVNAAIKIQFELPDPVLVVLETIGTLNSIIETIPT